MATEVLGKLTFLETPDVNGTEVLLNGGGVPTILAGTTGARPAASVVGRLYLDITVNRFYRDNGTSWDDLTSVPLIDGTANQIDVVDGTNVTPSIVSIASNPIIPGTEGMVPPSGTTAQRPVSALNGELRYNTTTTRQEFYNGTFWTPIGQVLQVVSGTISASTGTTQIPFDNTLPTSTEGHQIWSTTFTPISSTSRIAIRYQITAASGTNARTMTTSLLAGTTTIGAGANYAQTANVPYSIVVQAVHQPGSTATITFSSRLGMNGSGTVYCNQTSAATLAGALVSEYTIMELA